MDLDINYYPLIDCSSDGSALKPMTATTDEKAIKEHHPIWIMEAVPSSFRLCCTEEGYKKLKADVVISCPRCGNSLHMIGEPINRNKRGLYVCKSCRR